MRVALPQANLDKAEQFLMDVSHPESIKYGQHWSMQDIADTFAPSPGTVQAVTQWLHSSGISPERISRSPSLGWLYLNVTVNEAEKLLKTQYYVYKHLTGEQQIACTQYWVPEHVSPHLDFITPTVHLDSQVKHSAKHVTTIPKLDLHHRAVRVPVKNDTAANVGSPDSGSIPKKGSGIDMTKMSSGLAGCDDFIIPDCIRALYDIPSGTSANPKNSLGVVEFSPQTYVQEDLDLFFSAVSPDQVQKTPALNAINGATIESPQRSFAFNGEADIDLGYAMALVNPQNVTLYQVGDRQSGGSFNDFLDAIDGSYCTFDGGDDPSRDTIYPNPKGGYQGPKYCGVFPPTKVISISYDQNEAGLPTRYATRQCMEYLKLGLAGSTVVYAAGDFGVAGTRDRCLDKTTNTYNNGTGGAFNPAFPASCPFVTSIGATQLRPNATILGEEVACETKIRTGGGFSNVFALPDYQVNAVKSWFREHPPPYGADRFNNSQRTRGIPDVSASGGNHLIAVNGEFITSFGSSLAVPVVASVITLINEVRINAGKSSVGFINPVLYANPQAFNDITSGHNPGCGTPGFAASAGWDPVTGLGTPRFPELLTAFLALP